MHAMSHYFALYRKPPIGVVVIGACECVEVYLISRSALLDLRRPLSRRRGGSKYQFVGRLSGIPFAIASATSCPTWWCASRKGTPFRTSSSSILVASKYPDSALLRIKLVLKCTLARNGEIISKQALRVSTVAKNPSLSSCISLL